MRSDHIRKRIKALSARIALLSDVYHRTEHHRTKLAARQQIRAALRALTLYELELIRSEEWARLDGAPPGLARRPVDQPKRVGPISPA